MKPTRSYFCIHYLPDVVDESLLAGRCIKVLHGMFAHTGGSVAVSFPQWSAQSLGKSIAFVSTEKTQLLKLHQHDYYMVMAESGLFQLTDIKPVPDCSPEVRFVRNQRIGKLFPGEMRRRMQRAQRRAEARGEVFSPARSTTCFEVGSFHSAVMKSNSTKENYLLHIQKEPADFCELGAYSSYGLATNIEKRGTVPDLNILF